MGQIHSCRQVKATLHLCGSLSKKKRGGVGSRELLTSFVKKAIGQFPQLAKSEMCFEGCGKQHRMHREL